MYFLWRTIRSWLWEPCLMTKNNIRDPYICTTEDREQAEQLTALPTGQLPNCEDHISRFTFRRSNAWTCEWLWFCVDTWMILYLFVYMWMTVVVCWHVNDCDCAWTCEWLWLCVNMWMIVVVYGHVNDCDCVWTCEWLWLCMDMSMTVVVCEHVNDCDCAWTCEWPWLCVDMWMILYLFVDMWMIVVVYGHVNDCGCAWTCEWLWLCMDMWMILYLFVDMWMTVVVYGHVNDCGCVWTCEWLWLCVNMSMTVVVCEHVNDCGCVWTCEWLWLCVNMNGCCCMWTCTWFFAWMAGRNSDSVSPNCCPTHWCVCVYHTLLIILNTDHRCAIWREPQSSKTATHAACSHAWQWNRTTKTMEGFFYDQIVNRSFHCFCTRINWIYIIVTKNFVCRVPVSLTLPPTIPYIGPRHFHMIKLFWL